MQFLIIWFMRVVPPTALIVIGVAEIVAGYLPGVKDRVGHAPLPLSVGIIVFGVLVAALQVYLARLRQRARRIIASRP